SKKESLPPRYYGHRCAPHNGRKHRPTIINHRNSGCVFHTRFPGATSAEHPPPEIGGRHEARSVYGSNPVWCEVRPIHPVVGRGNQRRRPTDKSRNGPKDGRLKSDKATNGLRED